MPDWQLEVRVPPVILPLHVMPAQENTQCRIPTFHHFSLQKLQPHPALCRLDRSSPSGYPLQRCRRQSHRQGCAGGRQSSVPECSGVNSLGFEVYPMAFQGCISNWSTTKRIVPGKECGGTFASCPKSLGETQFLFLKSGTLSRTRRGDFVPSRGTTPPSFQTFF